MAKKDTKANTKKDKKKKETSHKTEKKKPKVPEVQEVTSSTPNHIIINQSDNTKKGKKGRWYIVHTYSGHEMKVAQALQQRAETLHLTDKILEILIPTQEKIKITRGKRKTVKEKIFPGYMLVKIIMSDKSWLAIRTTQGVTGFVGVGSRPTPLPKHEVESIQKYMSQGAPSYKADFTIDQAVRITDGPFKDFLGTVSDIDEDKGKVSVLVSIFGRETPVELDFLQVEKV